MEYNGDTERELSVLKAEALANMPDYKYVQDSNISVENSEKNPTEKSHGNISENKINNPDTPVVNSPEKVSVPKSLKAAFPLRIILVLKILQQEEQNQDIKPILKQ